MNAAVDSLAEAVKLINRSPVISTDNEQAPVIKRFSGLGTIPDFTYGTTGFGLRAAFSIFQPDQFDDVLYILNAITLPEARGAAVVILCREYLQSKMKSIKSTSTKKPNNN